MTPADEHASKKIVGHAGEHLNLRRGRHDLDVINREFRPPAHESFGITVGGIPLRRVVHGLVIVHLNHPLLVFRREQGEDGAGLVDAAVLPLGEIPAGVPSIPVGYGLFCIDRRTAGCFGLSHQRVVVFLRGLVGKLALDVVDGIVVVAVAPFGGARRIVADAAAPRPHVGQLARRVASGVALVEPHRLVFVEVLRRKHVGR